jgi:hypothetical protein
MLPKVAMGEAVDAVVKRTALAGENGFVSALNNAGVTYTSTNDIVEIGKAVCHDLSMSVAAPAVLAKLRESGFDAFESRMILLASIDVLYDERNPTVMSWMHANGY